MMILYVKSENMHQIRKLHFQLMRRQIQQVHILQVQ